MENWGVTDSMLFAGIHEYQAEQQDNSLAQWMLQLLKYHELATDNGCSNWRFRVNNGPSRQ